MSYAGNFLKSRGQTCTILRDIPVNSKVSIKRSTRSSRDLGSREAYWEGLILADAALQSGEVLDILGNKYLVQSANADPASGETAFFSAKCNAVIQHMRFVEDTDENNNVIQEWQTLHADVSCYGEIITYRLRQEDPGLLDSTKYTFQVPKSLGVVLLDRFVYGEGKDNKYKVSSIDEIGMSGVSRIQLESDTRP
ncbi:hypothetical protein CLHUN_02160 [Ruminiclostridium hungatei]|uniref:Uncharacterized protein n=1 Tax=Ruminiclostridium hungatei TaxID=48256 RepID=A0A1V4SR96_RUMHU|nr:hypothetical protein [Ruminiclostridium hungatei]OPX46400.1 hypothetical protein CLHUN_02160 [Ruminiclostridium hungatei]